MPEPIDFFHGKREGVRGRFAEAIAEAIRREFCHSDFDEARANEFEDCLRLKAGAVAAFVSGDESPAISADLVELLAGPLRLRIPDILGEPLLTAEQKAEWLARADELGFTVSRAAAGQPIETEDEEKRLRLFLVLEALEQL